MASDLERAARIVENEIGEYCWHLHIGKSRFCDQYGCSTLRELVKKIRELEPTQVVPETIRTTSSGEPLTWTWLSQSGLVSVEDIGKW